MRAPVHYRQSRGGAEAIRQSRDGAEATAAPLRKAYGDIGKATARGFGGRGSGALSGAHALRRTAAVGHHGDGRRECDFGHLRAAPRSGVSSAHAFATRRVRTQPDGAWEAAAAAAELEAHAELEVHAEGEVDGELEADAELEIDAELEAHAKPEVDAELKVDAELR
jgi:hypothetical protein